MNTTTLTQGIKISRVSKLDGIASWSLPARTSCPASKNVQVCAGCYATQGNYNYDNVKAPRVHNMEDFKRTGWVNDMIQELDNHRYFRWFDSGDVMNVSLALKILEVVQATPWVKHWIPTRSYKIPAIKNTLEEISKQPNAVVRYSSDNYNEDTTGHTGHRSVVISEEAKATGHICTAYKTAGKCDGCRACWNKDVLEINYLIHGRVALAQFRKLTK